MSKRVADVIVETLQAAGVRRCYGIVGDTLNRIAHAIHESKIEWVHMRHEEAGAFAASAEGQFTGELVACAGSCGPGSLHFINGLYEANRNRAPVVLIATQVMRADIGFNMIQEVDFAQVYKDCSVFCEMILTPEQARRKTVAACQAALTKRGVAVLVVPVDVSNAAAHEERPYTVHARRPIIRPSEADLDEIASILNGSDAIAIYAGAGCAGAHDEVVATAARLKAPMAHTSRGKDFVAHDNPYNVGRHDRRSRRLSCDPRLRHVASSRYRFCVGPILSRQGHHRSDRSRPLAYRSSSSRYIRRRRRHKGDFGGSVAAPAAT